MKQQSFWYSILCGFLALIITVNPILAQTAPRLPLFNVQVNVPGPMGTQVNTFNGNLYYSRTDLEISGRGLPLEISMTYNSGQSKIDEGFGFGWQFSYDLYYEKRGYDILIYRDNGRVDKYVRSGSTFLKPLGVRDTLEEICPHQYQLTSPNGTKIFFYSLTHTHVTHIQDPNGNTLSFSYDSDGQLTTIIDASGRQLNLIHTGGRLTTLIDPNTTPDRTLQFQYNSNGDLISITDPGGNTTTYGYSSHFLTSITDPRGNTATIDYDYTVNDDGSVSGVVNNISTTTTSKSFDYDVETQTTIVTDLVDGEDQVTRYTYGNGRISSIEDGLGHSVFMTWDDNLNLTSFTDENGHTTSYTYDANGNVLTVTDPLDYVTTYTYDSTYNKVTSIQDANNHITTYQYDANGNLIGTIDPLGHETSLSYDANGNLTSVMDANNHTTTYSYNSHGDLTEVVDPLGHATSFTYDNIGNMLTMTDAYVHTTTFSYDVLDRPTSVANPLGQQTSFSYDANGNLTTTTDPEGNTTTYTYDALDRLIRVTDALGNQTNYTYDQMGNLTTIIDAEGHITTFTYDRVNRLVRKTDAEGNTTSYTYDDASNLVGRTDANGDTTIYTYDDTNQLTAVDYPGSNDASYSYDNIGNRIGMSNADVSVSYSYDAADQLTSINVTTGTLEKSVSYTYDNAGNRATMTDPDGGVTTYTYDAADRLISLVNPTSQATNYTYDDVDRLTRKDHHNGSYALYTYDDADQLLSVIHKNSADTTLFSYAYQYDNAGNRVRMTEANGAQTDYTYDALHRLTGVTCTDGSTVSYAYDAVGNRTQLVDSSGTTLYTYDDADRLLSTEGTIYGWDHNGNQISKVESGDITTYAYDYENRLIGITYPDGSTNSFTYYPDGQRLSKTDKAGVTTHYFYDNFNTLVETDGSGATAARYTSGLSVDEWISMDRGGTTNYYHQDGLGSIIGLTDPTESIAAAYQYDAFGTITSETGSIVNPFRYTGRELEAESSLYNYRSRFYDPNIGRFLSRDLKPGSIGSPQTSHPYTYVNNNPIIYTDPFGFGLFKSIGKFVKKTVKKVAKKIAKTVKKVAKTVKKVTKKVVKTVKKVAKKVVKTAKEVTEVIAKTVQKVSIDIAEVGAGLLALGDFMIESLAHKLEDTIRLLAWGLGALAEYISPTKVASGASSAVPPGNTGGLFSNGGGGPGPSAVAVEFGLVGEVPSLGGIEIAWIDAIQVLDSAPNEIVFVTRNQGATCGGGTPASAWKMTLDPATGDVVSIVQKQSLSQIQMARGALFESSDGTLFTGGGWCGYKPPYYSTDGGETWQPADAGPVQPPNSTFSFVEFNGDVYAGTGYEPHHGQIYRWLGAGNWELVLDIAPPRSIVETMAVYENQLFVGSSVYWSGGSGCESSVPVYVSTDGNTFNATTGIPPCYSVADLLVVGDQFVARVQNYFDPTELFMYRWNNNLGEWEEIGVHNLGNSKPTLVSHGGVIYAYGKAPGDTWAGIYQSVDVGQSWQQTDVLQDPDVSAMAIHDDTLYIGTQHDANNTTFIYRKALSTAATSINRMGMSTTSTACGSITVVKEASITHDFDFFAEYLGDFTLITGDSQDFPDLASHKYTIAEDPLSFPAPRWALLNVTCEDENGQSVPVSTDLGNFNADIPLQPGQHVVCTFTNGDPTAIELASFTAKASTDRVILAWETGTEIDNAGFNLWRSETAEGPYNQLNDTLIPAEGDPLSGASYTHTDTSVVKGITYYYKLEDVNVHGVSTFHGPVSATPLLIHRIYLPLVLK